MSSHTSRSGIITGCFVDTDIPIIHTLLELHTVRANTFFVLVAYSLLIISAKTHSAAGTTVPISAELATSIAGDLFPVTIKLTRGNLFLTKPVLLFLDKERIGMQVRFQAYDHRPAEGVAISEMGNAVISGKIGYDPGTRRILLHDPRIDKIKFDQKNEATQRFLSQLKAAWSTQVTNPIRAEIPPHPYLLPFKNNIRDLSYDGKSINLTISYE
jgi:hypothetical protein